MTVDRKASSIESGFRIEGTLFDEECRRRVKGVLTKNISVADAIAELNRKYSVFYSSDFYNISELGTCMV